MQRYKWSLAAFLLALAANPVILADSKEHPSDTTALVLPKLTPLWHGVLYTIAGRYKTVVAGCDEILYSDPDDQRAYVLRGYVHLFKRNEDQQAIADFTEALRRGPDNAAIHVARAEAYARTKDHDRAIADCTEAIRIDPSNAEAYAQRAWCYLSKRVTNKAIADYTLALRHDPSLAWARCGRAEAYGKRGESARALADLEEVLRDDPENLQALANRCVIYLNNRHDPDRVIAECGDFLRRYPHYATWYVLRAMAYAAKGEAKKSTWDWATAVSLKPEYLHLHAHSKPKSVRFGFCFGPTDSSVPGEDDPDERIAACTKRLAEDPNNVAAYYERACNHSCKRKYKRAIADLDEIIRRDPADATAYYERSLLHIKLKSFAQVLADSTKAIRIDPDNADCYCARAEAYEEQGKDEDSLRDISHALQLEPRSAFAHVYRGWFYYKRKDYAPAIEDFSEAIRYSPVYADAYARRAWSYADDGEYAEGIADFKKALELDPQNLMAHRGLGWELATCPEAKLRDGPEAKKHATAACEQTEWKDPIHLGVLAAACAECGDFDQAIKWQTRVLELASEKYKDCYRKRLELYQSHQPYRQATHSAAVPPTE